LKVRPVIVDECVSPKIARYLEEMGEEVIRFKSGTEDNELRRVGHKTGAYIITRDKGFKDYERLILLTRKEKPKWIYEQLRQAKAYENR